jgi:sugar phosphate isomerase/epimerase
MRLSCLPVSLYGDLGAGRRTLADWFRLAAALGLDGADVSGMHVTSRLPANLYALRRQVADAGVEIAILTIYSDFIQPDARERARQVDDVRRWIDAAERLGASGLRVTAGQDRPDVNEADALGWAAEGLAACAAAAATDVRVLYENHVRGAPWKRNDFTQPARRFLEVVRRTRGSGLQILFDTANSLALDEEPAAILESVIDRLGAVHVSDIKRRGTFEPTVIGAGVSPIPQLLHRIVASGFDAWVSVEEASQTGEAGFRRAIEYADRAWVEAGGRPRDLPAERQK